MQGWAATTDARILVKSDNQVISPGAYVYIDSAPRMPNLTMLVIGGDGNPVKAAATWRLSISFLQTVNQVVERKDFKIPAGGSYTMPAPGDGVHRCRELPCWRYFLFRVQRLADNRTEIEIL